MKDRNVLVTGGAGYIGSHTCKVLKKNGYNPITFDNLSTGHRDFVKWGPLIQGDLLDKSSIEKAFHQYEINTVMHFAAKAYVHESIDNPIKYYRENIQGSMNLLETFVENKGKAFIFSSSCATYGEWDDETIDENTLQLPINPYGFTKLAIEKLILDLQPMHQFHFAVLRYFNAAGADSDLEIGEKHQPESHVIPLLIEAGLKNGQFKIYGKNHNTADGTAVRDYIHVTDIALAHLKSLEIVSSQDRNLVCNLGSGRGTSVLELVTELKKMKKDFSIIFEPKKKGDPSSLVASNTLSRKILNLNYENSNLENILKTALKWQEKNISR